MATTAAVEVQIGTGAAVSSMGELRKQLKEANFEVLAMSEKFGASSKEATEAAKRVAQLKDRIGDAKQLTEAFSPDKKFQAFSGALQGVVGGFSAVQGALAAFGVQSGEVEKTLVKVQGAMALSQGLNSVLSSIDAFKNLGAVIKASTAFQTLYNTSTVIAATVTRAFGGAVQTTSVGFKALRAAIISTGIGALVVGIGFVVDKLLKWTSSTDDNKEAQERLNATLEKQNRLYAEAQKTLKFQRDLAIKRAELAGASTQEINKINENFNKQDLAQSKSHLEQKLKEQQNYQDKFLTKSIENGQIMYEGTKSEIDQYRKIKDEVRQAREQTLELERKNQLDAIDAQKKINDEEKSNNEKAAQERKQKADKEAQERKQKADQAKQKREQEQKEIQQATKQSAENLRKLQEEIELQNIADENERAKRKLAIDLENAKKEIDQSKATTEAKNKEKKALEEKYILDVNEIDRKAKEDKLAKELKASQETEKMIADARIAAMKDGYQKQFEQEALNYQQQIDAQLELLNTKQITEDEYNKRREALKLQHETNVTAIQKQSAEAQKKIDEEAFANRMDMYKRTGDMLSNFADLVGRETAAGKAFAVASATIDTYQAAWSAFKNAQKNPISIIGPAYPYIQAGLAVAGGIANIKKILAVKVPGKGSGGGSAPSGGVNASVQAPIPVQGSATVLDQGQVNQMASATARAFVLESDVSGNQERIRRLNRAARIN